MSTSERLREALRRANPRPRGETFSESSGRAVAGASTSARVADRAGDRCSGLRDSRGAALHRCHCGRLPSPSRVWPRS